MGLSPVFILRHAVADFLGRVDLGRRALEGAHGIEIGNSDWVLNVVEELFVRHNPD